MRDYNQVRSEYLQWKDLNPDKDLDLKTFARERDLLDEAPSRQIAYDDNIAKQFNASIDRFFAPVGNLVAPAGALVDKAATELGYDSKGAGEHAMRALPRAAVELTPYGRGAGLAMKTLGRAAGAGSAGLQAYSQTDSIPAGLVGAAGPFLGAKGAELGTQAAAKFLTRGAPEVVANQVARPINDIIGAFVGSNVGGAAAGEVQRQAMGIATGEGLTNPFTAENVVSNIVGALPEALTQAIPDAVTGRGSAAVREARATKVDEYKAQLEQRVDADRTQRGFEAVQNEVGTTDFQKPLQEDITSSAVKASNDEFIQAPKETSVREVVEEFQPVDEATVAIRKQAPELARTFKEEIESTIPRVYDAADTDVVERAVSLAQKTDIPTTTKEWTDLARDVNQSIQDIFDQQRAVEETKQSEINRAKKFRELTGVGEDIVETPEPLERTEVTAFGPEAFKQFQLEGRIPKIAPEWLKERFGWHWENSITFTNQEAYEGVVRTTRNVLLEIAETAKKQKSLEIQRRAEIQSVTGRSVHPDELEAEYNINLAQLPEDLRSEVIEKRKAWQQVKQEVDPVTGEPTGKAIKTRGNQEQTQLSHHRQILDQAVKNWDRETGKTSITINNRVKSAEGGSRMESTTIELPIRDAVLWEPKWRTESTKTGDRPNIVSLDEIQEKEAERQRQQTSPDERELYAPRSKTVASDPKGLPSLTEPNPVADKQAQRSRAEVEVKELIEKIQDPQRFEEAWEQFKGIFPGKPEQKKGLFARAVAAKLAPVAGRDRGGQNIYTPEGKQAILEFGNASAGRPLSTSEAHTALNNFWRGGNWERFVGKMREATGLDEKGFDKAVKYDWTEKAQKTRMLTSEDVQPFNEGVEEHFRRHFRYAGYSQPLVEHFTALALKVGNLLRGGLGPVDFTTVQFADPLTKQAFTERVFERLGILGLYGHRYMDGSGKVRNNPLIAMPLEHVSKRGNGPLAAFSVISSLAHETVHRAEKGMLFGEQESLHSDIRLRATAYKNAYEFMKVMPEGDRYGMLVNLMDTVIPKQFGRLEDGSINPEIGGLLSYGSKRPEETIAVYAQMYMAGMVMQGRRLTTKQKADGTIDVVEALKWEPPDVQMFIRGVYRDVSQFTEGLMAFVRHPVYRKLAGLEGIKGDSAKIIEGIGVMHRSLKDMIRPDVEELRAKANAAEVLQFLDTGSAKPLIDATKPFSQRVSEEQMEFLKREGIGEVSEARIKEAIDASWSNLFDKTPGAPERMGVWNRWLTPAIQAAARSKSPMPMHVMDSLLGNNGARLRLSQTMQEPILSRKNGHLGVHDDPLWKAVFQDDQGELTRSHKAINKVGMVLQELGDAKELLKSVVPGPDGRYSNSFDQLVQGSPKLAGKVGGILQSLSPVEREQVFKAVNQMLEIGKNAGNVIFTSKMAHTASRVTRLMQTLKMGGALDLSQRGTLLMDGVFKKDNAMVSAAVNGLDPVKAMRVIEFAGDFVEPLGDLLKFFEERPYFMSEQRTGNWLVKSVDRKGDEASHGADSETHAKQIVRTLTEKGHNQFEYFDKNLKYGEFAGQLPEQYAETFVKLERAATEKALKRVEAAFGPGIAQQLAGEFAPAAEVLKQVTAQGINKQMQERKLVGGREDLNYPRVMQEYITRVAVASANRQTKDRVDILLNDPAMDQTQDFKAFAKTQMENVLRPNDETIMKLRTVLSANYLAANLGSMAINGLQNAVTLVPHLIKTGDTVQGAYKRWFKAMPLVSSMKDSNAFEASVRRGKAPGATPADEMAYWFRRYKDEHPLGTNAFDDQQLDQNNRSSVLGGRNRHGNFEDVSVGKLALNGVYQVAKMGMQAYGKVEGWNSQVAFVAAFTKAQENGLKGQAASDYATRVVYMTSGGGGKANSPGYVAQFAKATPAVGLLHTMQQYGYMMTSFLAHNAKDAIFGSKDRTDAQKKQDWKAFGTMFTTQVGLAGALGLPFAGAALTLLEQMTGVSANAAIRQGLASLAGDDEELGFLISDSAMNGVASQVLGFDVSSRTGLGNLVGTSSYSGFNMKDLAGPVAGVVGNLYEGIQGLAQGEPMKAATSLAPQAFKNAVQLYDTYSKFGNVQFMDKSNNMITDMSNMESIKYAMGFKPTRVRQYQVGNVLQNNANEIATRQRSKDLDNVAIALVKNDPTKLVEYVQQARENDPALDPRTIVNSVIDRAIDMSTPRDLLAAKGANEKLLSAVMGKPLNRQSELQRLDMREATLQKLGYPFGIRPAGKRELLRAQVIDELTSQGLSRKEAIKQFEARFHPQSSNAGMWDDGASL